MASTTATCCTIQWYGPREPSTVTQFRGVQIALVVLTIRCIYVLQKICETIMSRRFPDIVGSEIRFDFDGRKTNRKLDVNEWLIVVIKLYLWRVNGVRHPPLPKCLRYLTRFDVDMFYHLREGRGGVIIFFRNVTPNVTLAVVNQIVNKGMVHLTCFCCVCNTYPNVSLYGLFQNELWHQYK